MSGHGASGHGTRGRLTQGRLTQGAVAALGAPEEVAGFGLAGARLVGARSQAEAVRGWEELEDAALVVVTATVAAWLGTRLDDPDAPLTVVVPP